MMDDKLFHCQKCNGRIKLDYSLMKLNLAQVNLLVNKNNNDTYNDDDMVKLDPADFIPKERLALYNKVNNKGEPPIHYRNLNNNDDQEKDSSFNSNIFGIQDSDDDKKEKDSSLENDDNHYIIISSRINTLKKVFEILSSNQEIDHPLCIDCSNLLLANFKLKFDQNQREKEYYMSFLRKLKEKDNTQMENDDLDSKFNDSINSFEKLSLIEQEKLQKLEQLEQNKRELDMKLNDLKNQLNTLNENELNDVLKLRNNLLLDLKLKLNKLEQSKSLYQSHLNHLDNLRNLNIYSKFFQISSDDKDTYGTINGFRLGYKVPWSEINAALGQIVLLLMFLIRRLNFKLKNYRLIPMGSQSQIIKISKSNPSTDPPHKMILNLYSTNDFSLGKLFNFNKLDVAMIALLDIVSQIESKLLGLDEEMELPYAISSKRDSIGGKSIRITSNSEWTLGCKFLLTNINWILTYTSVHTTPSVV
ncbi:uncharacterized protein AC631_01446 [Debaryomyces fabryi]|uniref:Uncharacterized protein n=1 Tax=Debaryomyces fabryi TaxID=58627 RepID=A0A0V1Q2V5_9ASCO|nr:uncharacterized protein AC631_01446 [Debaryomyces fabryi]KSA02849.1 hypothetical protein AC631_01446 [Debaryomyces fabryi]CUM46143.1 unnamed protein product [Debaryomyces fabryi]